MLISAWAAARFLGILGEILIFLELGWDSRLIRSKTKVDFWAAELHVKVTLTTKT